MITPETIRRAQAMPSDTNEQRIRRMLVATGNEPLPATVKERFIRHVQVLFRLWGLTDHERLEVLLNASELLLVELGNID